MSGLVESVSGTRGIFKESLDESLAVDYANAYAIFLQKKSKKQKFKIVIGMDTRKSGPVLKQAFIDALMPNCNEIIDLDIATTPMIELAVRHYKADGGIIITASHNEPNFNGWKLLENNGAVLDAKSIHKIIKLRKEKKSPLKNKIKGKACKVSNKNLEISQIYRKFVLNLIGKKAIEDIKKAKLKIIVDPNGGASWSISQQLMKDLNVNAIFTTTKPGEFMHAVEPNEKSLSFMQKMLKEGNFDFGAGFDCDSDRAEFVVPFGELFGKTLSGNHLIALLADSMLPNLPKNKRIVVVNDATSQMVHEIVKLHGGKIFEVEVGESNVVNEMIKKKACLGGEGSSSGAILPPSKCRDGLLSTALLLSILAKEKKLNKETNLAEIIGKLPSYHNSSLKAKASSDSMNLKKTVKEYFKGYSITETGDTTGGIKVWIDNNSWIWFRGSKTEPGIVRIFADSKSEEKTDNLLHLGLKCLGKEGKMC